jgi:fibronectin-binding autotransporter adhesin
VLVTGTNSRWNNGGELYVGEDGKGASLTVANGGTVAAASITIGVSAGSSATLNIGRLGTNDTAGMITTPTIAFGAGTGTINFNQSDATTVSAAISGAGSLNQRGVGTTTLSGNNTYSGGTTINAGALQLGNGGTTGSLGVGAVTNNASLIVNRSDAFTLANTISGTGGFTQTGSGTTTLSGVNTYGGTTTVAGGTLQVANLANAGANSAIGTNATIILTNGGVFSYAGASNSAMNRTINLAGDGVFGVSNSTVAVTYSGAITNTGDFTKSGAGTLVLSASNRFSGTTTVSAGMLSLANTNALSASTLDYSSAGRISFSNLTGVKLGGLQGSTSLVLTNASGTAVALNVGGNSSNTTYSGILSGGGSLIKAGAGTLVLSGLNTYTGATTISNGAVRISTANGLGATNGGTTVIAGAALEVDGGITIAAEALTLNNNGISSGGALRNISGTNTYGGLGLTP